MVLFSEHTQAVGTTDPYDQYPSLGATSTHQYYQYLSLSANSTHYYYRYTPLSATPSQDICFALFLYVQPL